MGFTLIEVMIALTIGVIVLVGARAVLTQIADSANRTSVAALVNDRQANIERTVRELFERTVAADSIAVFQGDASRMQFTSWCDVPAGWRELCEVWVRVTPISDRDTMATKAPVTITLTTSFGDTLQVYDTLSYARLQYLEDPANGGVWRPTWPAGMETPIAVRIAIPSDTMILRIGERR